MFLSSADHSLKSVIHASKVNNEVHKFIYTFRDVSRFQVNTMAVKVLDAAVNSKAKYGLCY